MAYYESEPVICSYVFYGGKGWCVSTARRPCSSPHVLGRGMYHETLVCEWDSETKETGKLVHEATGLDKHFEICRGILMIGPFWEAPDYEP